MLHIFIQYLLTGQTFNSSSKLTHFALICLKIDIPVLYVPRRVIAVALGCSFLSDSTARFLPRPTYLFVSLTTTYAILSCFLSTFLRFVHACLLRFDLKRGLRRGCIYLRLILKTLLLVTCLSKLTKVTLGRDTRVFISLLLVHLSPCSGPPRLPCYVLVTAAHWKSSQTYRRCCTEVSLAIHLIIIYRIFTLLYNLKQTSTILLLIYLLIYN